MAQNSSGRLLPRAVARRLRLGMIFGALAVVTACVLIRYFWGAGSAGAAPPDSPAQPPTRAEATRTPERARSAAMAPATAPAGPALPASARGSRTASGTPAAGSPRAVSQAASPYTNDPSRPQIVAVVNNEPITREQLGQECLRHYGKEVLESMVNKQLIAQECKRRNITVTRAEVDAEIDRLAQRFNLAVDQWLKLLRQERGITPVQYASDIIWPTLALRKLADERLKVTPQELREAYDTQYGPAVRARMITCKDRQKAERVRAAAAAKPNEFGELAQQYSEDPSASLKGLVHPIRKHIGFPEIEQAAFNLKPGEVSAVIPCAGQFIILKCEEQLPGVQAVDFRKAAPQLEEAVRDRKMRSAAAEIFQQLQKSGKIDIVLQDPARSRTAPGVAAVVNGQPISLRELAEQCIERHGEQVLEGTINRRLLEQGCQRRNITVSDGEIDQEIARAAADMLPPKADGTADVEQWLKMVTVQQGISLEIYRSDSVWPSVALKKLAGGNIQVTEEDLKKGYESNFGPRVRCRAIVLGNARRAQEVWEKIRKRPTLEYFGTLAEQYSVEPGSQALQGEVPPIRKHGGQPLLEKEAFALKVGEVSGIIQVADKFVILYCEGFTKPVEVAFEEVRNEIYKDIHEKKLRLAMADCFEQLQETATVDNFLAGSSHTPKDKQVPTGAAAKASPSPAKVPTLRQVGEDDLRRPRTAIRPPSAPAMRK